MKKEEKKQIGIAVFTGGMFLGWGIGMLLGEPKAGMFIGMGSGFLLSGIFVYLTKQEQV